MIESILSGVSDSLSRAVAPLVSGWAQFKPLEKASLLTGALAALAALLNALASIFNGWRENRWLKITLVRNEFAEHVAGAGDYYPFDLKISNPAKAANFITGWHCYIDSTRQPCSTEPVDFLARPIRGYGQVGGFVNVPAQKVMAENYKKITFIFEPIRGRRRKFIFKQSDLVHPF